MTATQLAALNPDAATYVRTLHALGTAGLLREHGDTDPSATLALIGRAVATHLAPIAA
jgi:hypothetical protein